MRLKLLYQSLIFLIVCICIQCEYQEQNIEIKKEEYLRSGDNLIENGRIISKPIVRSMPIDQIEPIELQQDNINQNKPNKYIARGDILIPIEEIELSNSKRLKRKIIAETNVFGLNNRWPNGIIPYEFIRGIDYRVQQNVLDAFQHWHERTCIRFEPYNSKRHWNINSKIIIEDTGSGCATFVGYRPFLNNLVPSYSVYLPLQCPFGSIVHELGHVIGFYHEMARTDRDQEINLYFNLMSTTDATQYDIMPNPMPGYYGQPYDLSSIMHYFPTNVMTARDNRRTFLMGQRVALSFLDSKLANLAYHCSDNCNPKPVCENEGYVNQYCKCTCPDGFYGNQCNLLQGYLDTSRPVSPDNTPTSVSPKPQIMPPTTTKPSKSAVVHWLEWSNWSNCSESCGSGVRVRTRLCSNTTIDGGSEPCSALGGESFEIESCYNTDCKQSDIIISCTFDLIDEKCPLKQNNNWQIYNGTKINQINDHTRGDGKYLLIIGNTTQLNDSQKFHLGPFTYSNFSNKHNHCLQFWYFIHGKGVGRLTIISNKTNNSFTFGRTDQDGNWKQIQQTISTDTHYEIIFSYESMTLEYNHIIIE